MSLTGTVKDGVVVLPADLHLPDGIKVELTIPDRGVSPEESFLLHDAATPFPTVEGLPDDLAANLDYYVHGHQEKEQPRRGRWIPVGKATRDLTEQEANDATEHLRALSAETEDLPADLSTHHDHYLHGRPKQ